MASADRAHGPEIDRASEQRKSSVAPAVASLAELKEPLLASPAPAPTPSRADDGLLSTVFLLWVFKLIREGSDRARELTDDRLPGLPPGWSAHSFRERGQAVQANQGTASLYGVCWRLLRCELGVGLLLSLCLGLLYTVARPLVLMYIVRAVKADEVDRAYWLAAVLSGILLLETILQGCMRHILGERLVIQFALIAGSLIQDKQMRLKSPSDAQYAAMISTDIVQIVQMTRQIYLAPLSLVLLAGGTVTVILIVGWGPGMSGMSVLIAAMGGFYWTVARNQVSRKAQLTKIDARSAMVTHVVEGMKAIKLHAWEQEYADIIGKLREDELATTKTMQLRIFIIKQFGCIAPSLAACITFLYIGVSGEQLETADVFATLGVFLALGTPLRRLPVALNMIGFVRASFGRLTDFINLPEQSIHGCPDDPNQMVVIQDAHFSWSAADPEQAEPQPATLSRINLIVPKGSLTAVIGAVGSGKSTLLAAMLSEVGRTKGSCLVNSSSMGYTAQSAFVIHGTVRENVVMQHEYDPVRFNMVAEATCLAEDIAEMVDGLNTEIGERGITLSGGQQARLAIARALYINPGMLLLDDPLAAVDNKVANHILQHAIIKYVRAGGTCVMAINQLHLLSNFDRVVLLEDGRVVEEGTYESLIAAKGSLESLLDELDVGALKVDPADEVQPKLEAHSREEKASVLLVEQEMVQKGECTLAWLWDEDWYR